MRVLSFETATYFGGVGFLSDDGARDSAGPFSARGSSREILPAARHLLRRHGCSLDDIDVIAVSTGPGLFTGVRVGLSLAKTMAWTREASGRPALAGVGTLRAVGQMVLTGAGDEVRPGDVVAAITDARRGEVYAALFEVSAPEEAGGSSSLRRIGEDVVVRPERVASRLFEGREARGLSDRPVWLVGDGVRHYMALIPAAFGEAVRVYPYEEGDLRIEVARLGLLRFTTHGGQTPDEVEPHYVRRPDARPPAAVFLGNE